MNVLTLRPTLCGIAKKTERQPSRWDIYRAIGSGPSGAVGMLMGTVEAPDEATAIEKAAAEYKMPATKLIAVPRR